MVNCAGKTEIEPSVTMIEDKQMLLEAMCAKTTAQNLYEQRFTFGWPTKRNAAHKWSIKPRSKRSNVYDYLELTTL